MPFEVAAPHELVGVGAVVGAHDIRGPESPHGARAAGLFADTQVGHAQRLAAGVSIPQALVKAAAFVHVFIEL